MLCPDCSKNQQPGLPLSGILEVVLDGTATREFIIRQLLPVEAEFFPNVPVGPTPLWSPARLRETLGLPHLYLKDDTGNPTGSFKDRASLLVAAFARKHGIRDIVVASTGNAASSMAGIGAAAGLNVRIFVPENVPRAKLIQSLQYGADVTKVPGTYDDAFARSLEYSREHGGLNRNTGFNPMTIEGKKTVALEIYQQLGSVPDWVFVPTGDGVILGGVFKGFEDLMTLGISERMPTVVAVQARQSRAISEAFHGDGFSGPVVARTVADSISVGVPANGYGAVRKLKSHGGRCAVVTDDDILDAQHTLSKLTGLFAEPAAAASLAGLLELRDAVPPEDSVVLLVTGSGLKDIDAASRRVEIDE